MHLKKEQFDRFWQERGQYLGCANPDRLRRSLGDLIAKGCSVEELDDYVCTLRTGKESTRKLVLRFYDYLIDRQEMKKTDTVLYDRKFFDVPFERQLEIARFLHEPKTIREIQDRFGIDARTVRSDLAALENGLCVLGSTIRCKKEKIGRKVYFHTTLHPVFLPLNLTEVYALTGFLEKLGGSQDFYSGILRSLSNRIKGQLSDYALEKLFPGESFETLPNRYVDDEALARDRDGIVMYLLKSGQPCTFWWKGKAYRGTIGMTDGRFAAKLENGQFLDADLNELEFVPDSVEYR